MGPTNQKRKQTEAQVEYSYKKLARLLNNSFPAGFFNQPEVLQAEANGLSVCDAVLGHVLRYPHSEINELKVDELIKRVENSIDPEMVENKCHNLHAALATMLDLIGCPSIVAWGSVKATYPNSSGFCLSAYQERAFVNHRPGHSWVVTPNYYVVDLALAYQYNVGDDYEKLKTNIPSKILIHSKETTEPLKDWFKLPDDPKFIISTNQFANETRYLNLLGWSKFISNELEISYFPGSVNLSSESDLDDFDLILDGMKPGQFFKKKLMDLVN